MLSATFCVAARSLSIKATSAPAAAAKALAVAAPIAPPAPVTTATWPARGNGFATAELGLLQRPVFDVEHVVFGDRFEPAERFGVDDARDERLGEIGGDDGVLFGPAQAEQAKSRHQHHARRRIEHFSVAADAGVLAGEVGLVARP